MVVVWILHTIKLQACPVAAGHEFLCLSPMIVYHHLPASNPHSQHEAIFSS